MHVGKLLSRRGFLRDFRVKMMGDKKQSFNHASAILKFEKLAYVLYILPRCNIKLVSRCLHNIN